MLVLLASLAQATEVSAQAERLAALRAEVETLSSELELDKEDLRGRLRALEAQKVEVEAQTRREELKLERLLLEEQRQADVLRDAADADLADVVQQGIRSLRAVVATSLPFERQRRLDALDQLDRQLADGSLTAEAVATRLWAFAEDERRLARSNALGRQVLQLPDGELLVDTARLGMVALYYRTPDGRYGHAVRGDDWTWTEVDGDDAVQVAGLFDALGKGIRTGAFVLPGVIP